MRTCGIEGCDRPHLAKGLCRLHYQRKRNGRVPLDAPIQRVHKKREMIPCKECGGRPAARSGESAGYCNGCWTRGRRAGRNDVLIERLGGKCADCGVSYPSAVYDFHHLDPSQKRFTIGTELMVRTMEELIEEADKCVLLCANCHRLRHYHAS